MPTENADIFTLAKFGGFEHFKMKYSQDILNTKHSSGSGLLHYAISGRQFEIAEFLIEEGIDVNTTNEIGQTPIHLVAMKQNIDIAQMLLEKGADINIKDNYGISSVWTAVFNCRGTYYVLVETMMKYGAIVDTKNNVGKSPLDFAIQINDTKLINILKGR